MGIFVVHFIREGVFVKPYKNRKKNETYTYFYNSSPVIISPKFLNFQTKNSEILPSTDGFIIRVSLTKNSRYPGTFDKKILDIRVSLTKI